MLVCDRPHMGLVDAEGTGGLLAQVEGRISTAAIAWLNAQPAPWRAGITPVSFPSNRGGFFNDGWCVGQGQR